MRVLVAWRDRASDPLGRLKSLAADPHPRVRLEAVRGASFFPQAEAIEVVLIAQDKPADPFVEHVSKETMKALEPHLRKAIADGRELKFSTPAGTRYFLRSVPTDDLLKMKRTPAVATELLGRPGVRDEARREAAALLASADMTSPAKVLLAALRGQDRTGADDSVSFDLARLLTDRPADLAGLRADIEAVATASGSPTVRQLAFTALVAADGSADQAWGLAVKSAGGLRDFVTAVPAIRDPNQRAALYPRVAGLLNQLPPSVAGAAGGGAVTGRFVRVELPGPRRTLTLAEVEVMSGGRNVARKGKATSSSFSHEGYASRAIDGNTSGEYARGGQTHSLENERDPWWEVDLGSEVPVETVAIYNRTDGQLGGRLKGYTLKVLDRGRNVVFEKKGNPAPESKATFKIGEEAPGSAIRKAAMLALTAVRGKEGDTFNVLAPLVAVPADRQAAVQAIQRIPVAAWPKEQAAGLIAAVSKYVASVPQSDRTSPAVLDALQFADALAGLLPRDQAKAARRQLGDLGVRVVRVGTLTDQMLFDKDRIVVQAGKPVEFVFENTDIMPHNFVVTKMGALEEVGNAAEAFGSSPGAAERGYVPPSDKVLLASRLLMPRDTQVLRFTAPASPGVYPYVCTYPGHWRRMHGCCTWSPTWTSTSPTRPGTSPRIRCRCPTSCSRTSARGPSGRWPSWPRRSPSWTEAAGRSPTASRCSRSAPASLATSSPARGRSSGRTWPTSTRRCSSPRRTCWNTCWSRPSGSKTSTGRTRSPWLTAGR